MTDTETALVKGKWFYISIIPALFAVFILIVQVLLTLVSFEKGVPIDTVINVVLSELEMVIAAFGIVAYIKTSPKVLLNHVIALLNVIILIGFGVITYHLFLSFN